MDILAEDNYTIVTRHFINLLYTVSKFLFIIFIATALCIILILYKETLGREIILYVLFPAAFLLVNYGFVQLILGIIRYYNRLVVIVRDKFIIINSSLMLQEDFEIMDLSKVMKIDVHVHGFFASLFGYGDLVMEQQKDEVRVIHTIPTPYKVWQIIREKTSYIGQQGWEVRFFKAR
ncbi:MAG: hypothetical protein ACD_78C00074G0004 [uncultured bacterium (gcode 4)]|uniref:DUF304 domain-containing protein n=1 Tax=uncultured bacterium (gcode 4) TaxID=1234023 RepID=K1XJ25_9BACT|nr:MAG: hypothetical protein ACD_78C00074G0004 [uncultured bacterium (gcode 4)]